MLYNKRLVIYHNVGLVVGQRTDAGFISNDSKLMNAIQISSFSVDVMSERRKLFPPIVGFLDII
jgi:hypothetical protein